MSKLIQRNAPLLHFLATCNNTKQLKEVVNILDDDQLKAIAECNHNVIKGVVPLSKGHLARCRLKRKHLLDLDEDDDLDHLKGKTRKTQLRLKRKRILQKGGVLPILLAPLLGAIIGPLIKAGIGAAGAAGIAAVGSTIKSRQIRKVHEKQHKERMRKLRQNQKTK